MAPPVPPLDVHMDDLRRLVERTRQQTPLTDEEYTTLKAAIETLGYVADLLEQKGTTIANLRQLLFGTTTEKTRDVLAQAGVVDPTSATAPSDDAPPSAADRRRDRPPGHGRHAAAAYAGARRIDVPHAQLHHGDRCPHCTNGKLYVQRESGLRIRFMGQAPIAATVYALEKLRCNLC